MYPSQWGQIFTYSANGNVSTNNYTGSYSYATQGKPHAVSKIVLEQPDYISEHQNSVAYNFFNQPSQITEGAYRYILFYGADKQRNTVYRYVNNSWEYSKYYLNKYYEKVENATTDSLYQYNYIFGDNGVVALNIKTYPRMPHDSIHGEENRNDASTDAMYYIHTDHLGSYCVITDTKKNVVQSNRFSPWGNNIGTADFTFITRGFTGHEHYPELKIINMNARLYDPMIARFFSPDNFVQIPEFTQAYNRYSYCLNNPLKYVDQTGNTWYDVKGNRRFIDDGIDDLLINVNKRQFNRLERRFNRDFVGYENLRERMSVRNGYYTFSAVYGIFGNEAGYALPALSINKFEAGGFSYSERNYRDALIAANPGVAPNILFGEPGIIYSPVNVGDFVFLGMGVAKMGMKMLGNAMLKDGANVVARDGVYVAKTGQTIVGEGMKRVSMEAAKRPGSVTLNNMPKFIGTDYQVTSQMMTYNRQWMLQQMRSGRPIIDIGLDLNRANPSIFYQMEQNMMRNYLKLHPNAFQIITP
jgi:RHS repeat-associated protein